MKKFVSLILGIEIFLSQGSISIWASPSAQMEVDAPVSEYVTALVGMIHSDLGGSIAPVSLEILGLTGNLRKTPDRVPIVSLKPQFFPAPSLEERNKLGIILRRTPGLNKSEADSPANTSITAYASLPLAERAERLRTAISKVSENDLQSMSDQELSDFARKIIEGPAIELSLLNTPEYETVLSQNTSQVRSTISGLLPSQLNPSIKVQTSIPNSSNGSVVPLSKLAIERLLGQLGYGRLSAVLGLARYIGRRSPTLAASMGRLWDWSRPEATENAQERTKIAAVLATNLSQASARQKRLVAWIMRYNPELRNAFWKPLEKYVLSDDAPSTISPIPGFPEWFGSQEFSLKNRMPTLWSVLQNPAKIGRLLFALSFLRMVYSFEASSVNPIEWGRQQGIEFNLGEVTITPQSDSFRRLIFTVNDAREQMAIEIKMPGDLPERKILEPLSIAVANDILHRDPEARIAQPVYLGEWTGRIQMYGKNMSFSAKKPLVIMFFDYQDGKRYLRSTQMLRILATRYKLTNDRIQQLKAEALADVVWTSYLTHELGWRGQGDTHSDNFRIVPILEKGKLALRGVMVDDFEAYEKSLTVKTDWKQRQEETGLLIEYGMDDHGPALRQEIYRVLEHRIHAKISNTEKASEILDHLRRELRLEHSLKPS